MNSKTKGIWKMSILGVFLLAVMQTSLFGFTLTVQEPDGTPVTGYRWLVEEDTTNYVVPGVQVSDSISVSIHNSYAPVVTKGHTDTAEAVIAVPSDKRYIVSVLPDAGHSISGHLVDLGQAAVTVVVNKQPIPTAQITVLAFHDNFSINNAPDIGEPGLEGFTVTIADIGGQQMLDAFGNPLGTTYQQNPDGSFVLDVDGAPVVDVMGNGIITTDANGEATIKYIPPGKYACQVVPPAGQGWIQDSTIEGTKVIDAWVKANEPPVLVEFGPALYHVFFGFVRQFNILDTVPNPSGLVGSMTGRLVYNHVASPLAQQGVFSGPPVPEGWIGLNSLGGQGVYAAPCDEDGNFTISNVPPGSYQLVTWDENLLSIFGFNTVTIPDAISGAYDLNLGDVTAFNWFGTFEGSVFLDDGGGDPTKAHNGFRDPGEVGIIEQNINIRFRDGTIYQAQPTDIEGGYALETVFPFFKWLVVEVDFARFRDTGMTAVVDQGGEIPPDNGWDMPSFGKINPQPQAEINPNTGNNLSRTQVSDAPGAVLLEAMQDYAGQTNRIDWGKRAYNPGENGGISGLVYYAITRAENDPRYAAAEPWEPGIPRVQINLYMDTNMDGVIDDLNGDGGPTLADVDNYPFGWQDGGAPGTEDVDRNGNGNFDAGDAVQIATTDSWDDNKPTGSIVPPLTVNGQPVINGIDNFSTWNQVRPGVFDGGYAISSYFPGGIESGSAEVDSLPSATYIVEAAMPPGYEIVKEEDKNVDFGDEYTPSPQLLPPICVGDPHLVPDFLTLFPDVPCFYAGQTRPLADRKQIAVSSGKNAAVEFFMFTEVPKAARAVGFVNNDIAAEFNPDTPNYGEKGSPSWIPILFQDWAGNEVARIYLDEFGAYNALLPSTFTANVGAPSGMSPHMVTFVLNHPGPIPNPALVAAGTFDETNPSHWIIDPWYDPGYSQTAYTFNFMPGSTTYLDTPVIQVAAFVGYPNRKMDVEPATGTPVISSVAGPDGGPVVSTDGATVTITSVGNKMVPNPGYNPDDPASEPLIQRDFGFGATQGTVTVGGAPLAVTSWTNETITAIVDFASVSTGTLNVTRNDSGLSTELGVTLHVNPAGGVIHVTGGSLYPNTPIQDAIDAASAGDLIIIEPGMYWENPIVYRAVTLQGSGASTVLNATHSTSAKLTAWRDKYNALATAGQYPAEPEIIPIVEAPGILVYANAGTFSAGSHVTVDGLTITGATAGPGVLAYGNADYLEVRNSKIINNQGSIGGGVVVGQHILDAAPTTNTNVNIHHNQILLNGGITGGGGVTLHTGSTNYQVTNNLVMGNFARFHGGGGVSHVGLSDNGLIADNTIAFNEVAYGGEIGGDGGGVHIAPYSAAAVNPGTGSVTLDGNLIQGNLAGSGLGGGIFAEGVNGQDVTDNPGNPDNWYSLNIFNNIVVNNAATDAAGGIYLADVAKGRVIHNTVANNDSAGTAANTFTAGNLAVSNPQPAGVVAALHSPTLAAASGQEYSNPILSDNIVHGNRSWYWDITLGTQGDLAANASDPLWDLAVHNRVSATQVLNPDYCLLSSLTDSLGNNYDDGTNIPGLPAFVDSYDNTLVSSLVIEEGGNAITTRFDEIDRQGDYHITAPSPAVGMGGGLYVGVFPELDTDFDDDNRVGYTPDMGADQYVTGVGTPVEVIVDNLDAATSSVGVWLPSGAGGFYATNSVWANDAGDSYTFNATLASGAAYAVYEWHTSMSGRNTAAAHQIRNGATLIDTVNVNQLVNGGQWNLLGVYVFNGPASVTILAAPGSSTNADAIRFLPVGTVNSLEITGPLAVTEGMAADYDAIAHFSSGLSLPVQPQTWGVDIAEASIDGSGLLTAGSVDADTPAVVSAQYTLNYAVVNDTHNITVLNGGGGVPVEVIVDNLDAGASSVGVWLASGAGGFYATDSVWANDAGDSFTFSANLVPGVTYQVYEWHTQYASRYTAVPHQIFDGATLLATVNVDQQVNGGGWNLLGAYTFNGPASVTILATPGFSSCADAIRFVPVTTPVEVIVDNGDASTSSVGTWLASGASGFYGTNSVWANDTGETFTFNANLMAGTYDVYEWHTAYSNRNSAAPHQIYDGGTLLGTVNVDQLVNGGQWNLLGQYTFTGPGSVTILASPGSTTNADAVRFVPVP